MNDENIINECWQYTKRVENLSKDLIDANLTKEFAQSLRISDFEFCYIPKDDQARCLEVKNFIERHEWLGRMPARPTHRFAAYYWGHLAGVIVMATPNAFSHLLGKENMHLEKLISRGACISWSPKNLGSWLIMKSINWMVQNTNFRFFTCYADTAAKELGTIYQSCGFIYLGKKSGTRYEFFDPKNPQRGWFSDRQFRKVGQYKKYARSLGIEWGHNWNEGCKILWKNVPSEIKAKLAQASIVYMESCDSRKVAPKHKYVYIKGQTKAETKKLLKAFKKQNPKLDNGPNIRPGLPYPKVRGE